MKMRPMPVLLFFGIILAATACASTGTGTTTTRRDSNVLMPEEIAEAPVSNLYEAVERFRPRWLLIRSPRSLNMQSEVSVFLNSSYLGGPESLRQVGVDGVVRLRYLDGPTASALYTVPDGRAIEGAIIVETGGDR